MYASIIFCRLLFGISIYNKTYWRTILFSMQCIFLWDYGLSVLDLRISLLLDYVPACLFFALSLSLPRCRSHSLFRRFVYTPYIQSQKWAHIHIGKKSSNLISIIRFCHIFLTFNQSGAPSSSSSSLPSSSFVYSISFFFFSRSSSLFFVCGKYIKKKGEQF